MQSNAERKEFSSPTQYVGYLFRIRVTVNSDSFYTVH
jgi:hypothetical protein